MTDWATAEAGPQMDAAVAQVMGWSLLKEPDSFGRRWGNPDGQRNRKGGLAGIWTTPVPPFSTAPAADYEVVCYVREKWDVLPDGRPHPQIARFLFALNGLLWRHAFGTDTRTMPERIRNRRKLGDLSYAMWYRPGDYSRAALMAAEKEKPCPTKP